MGAIDKFLNDYILGEDFKNKTGAFAPREKTKSQLKQEDLAIKRQIASDIQGGGIKNLMPMLANYTVAEPLAFIGSVLPGETFTYKNLSKKLKTPLQYDNEVVKRIFNVDLDSLEGEEKEAAINQIDSFIRKNSNVSGIAEAASFLVGGGFGTKAGTKAGATARKLKDPAYADELTPNMFKPNNNLPLPSVGAKSLTQAEKQVLSVEAKLNNKINMINENSKKIIGSKNLDEINYTNTLGNKNKEKASEFIFPSNQKASLIIKDKLKKDLLKIYNGPEMLLHKEGMVRAGNASKVDPLNRPTIHKLGREFGYNMDNRSERLNFMGAINNFLKQENLFENPLYNFKKTKI